MIHDYDNPNTCYAVGDAVAVLFAVNTVVRQPAAGVEERIMMVVKAGTTDDLRVYDGTNSLSVALTAASTSVLEADAAEGGIPYGGIFNMGLMITNSVYIQKNGAGTEVSIHGVQTNA